MIELTRSLAKQFRSIARKTIMAIEKQDQPRVLVVRGDRSGLRIFAQNTAGAVEYYEPGAQPNETYRLPFTALADFDGKKETTIQLTDKGAGVEAAWQEGIVPQVREYDTVEAGSYTPPDVPSKLTVQSDTFLRAMQDASESCAKASTHRYGLCCIQLRGKAGDIIGTDGSQLLRQSGFDFPWKDDVLIPSMPVFASRELGSVGSISVGKSDDFVCFVGGPWKIFVRINKDARFPSVDKIIPNPQSATVVSFDDGDVTFLTDALPSLPNEDEVHSPITIDANGKVNVRAGAKGQSPTELTLVRSQTRGKAVTFAVNRLILGRALRLGFRSLYVHTADLPVLLREGTRDFVTPALGHGAITSENKNSTKLVSTAQRWPDRVIVPASGEPVASYSTETPTNGKHKTGVNGNGHSRANIAGEGTETNGTTETLEVKPETNGSNGHTRQDANGIAALIHEAESLKELMRDGYTRAHALASAAKRYRKQARVVNSTLASLRQLQAVEA